MQAGSVDFANPAVITSPLRLTAPRKIFSPIALRQGRRIRTRHDTPWQLVEKKLLEGVHVQSRASSKTWDAAVKKGRKAVHLTSLSGKHASALGEVVDARIWRQVLRQL